VRFRPNFAAELKPRRPGPSSCARAMRLINTSTLQPHDFSSSTIPKHAILSHTWGKDEITFQDMQSHSRASTRGWAKITETCRLAQDQYISFAWIDTCCIDKSSSVEPTESINSMFKWYRDAVICYVYLEDLEKHLETVQDMSACRWLTRGWNCRNFWLRRKSISLTRVSPIEAQTLTSSI
jgi:hypothetical protein